MLQNPMGLWPFWATFPPPAPPHNLVTVEKSYWVKRIILSCHMSNCHWFLRLHTYCLSIIVDFHPLRRCSMSTWAPLGYLCLTNSVPDARYLLNHLKYVKCSILSSLSRKACKFRLSRNSMKFDVIARFRETIPTMKSVSSSEIQKNFGF